jgi:hypothetical protein
VQRAIKLVGPLRVVDRLCSRPEDPRAEWPAVVTCRRTVEEARELLLDAASEMIASYRNEGREPPIGGGHAEQVTIDLAAA